MHRTVPKTLLHSSLATGTSNGDPVVQQKKKVQKRPFLTLKTVPFGPPIPAPGSPRTHKTKKFSSRVMIPDNYASKGVNLRRNEKKWFDRWHFWKVREVCVSTFSANSASKRCFLYTCNMLYTWGGSSVELTGEAYKKQHFEFSYKETFFSTRTETHTNYTKFERWIKKKCEK
jgi:hypothetical protein